MHSACGHPAHRKSIFNGRMLQPFRLLNGCDQGNSLNGKEKVKHPVRNCDNIVERQSVVPRVSAADKTMPAEEQDGLRKMRRVSLEASFQICPDGAAEASEGGKE